MPEPPTQKQISERYWKIVGRYLELHPWRLAKTLFTWICIIGGIAAIILHSKHGSPEFFNAGNIASAHAQIAHDCKKCHEETAGVPQNSKQFVNVVADRFRKGLDFTLLDQKCDACHKQHALHEPNVIENRSCSACHMEHQGSRALRVVANSQCAACHNNADVMQASAVKGMQMPQDAFHLRHFPRQQVVFQLPRPPRGFTEVIDSFENKHPEFQVVREHARDPDVLRFNHQRHLNGPDIPQVDGRKLDCGYCHKPTIDGRFMQRIDFTTSCQACHSLQFDMKNPEMQLPHGDPTAVRGYLHSLPTHYADLAVRKGITRPEQIQTFVAQQISQLRDQVRSGEELERRVFFTVDPYKPQPGVAGTRAAFYGCAFCHEVKAQPALVPAITKPVLVDRWMTRSHFNHAKHTTVACDTCHHATQSRETSDVLMPVKASCISCHSAKGKVSTECMLCHTYHAPPQVIATQAPTPGPVSWQQRLRERVATR